MHIFKLMRPRAAGRLALSLAACTLGAFPATAAPKTPVPKTPVPKTPVPKTPVPKIPLPTAYHLPTYTQAVVYTSARDTGDRLHPGPALQFTPLAQPDEWNATLMIDPTRRFQTIVGFGGTFTDAAAETYALLPAAKQAELLRAYFSPETGLGYTLGRTTINSCDFSSDTYSYDDTPGDTTLTRFSIAHDLKYRVPLIKAALAVAQKPFALFASPWSPPAWMKTNSDMNHGGSLKPEARSSWAQYYVRFVQEYRRQGIPLWGLTVQNEPLASQSWESCIYTGEDERDFVRDFLGPALRRAKMADLHLMVWDHNRGLMYQRAQTVYEDPAAAQYVWGTAFHWYTGDHFDNPQAVHEAFPNKALLFTEGTVEGVTTDPAEDWARGEKYGKNILLDLSHWAVGWTDWNLLLNAQGGPNHVGNYCAAPIMADTAAGTLTYHPPYYYMGHFSKFIRPGARRIADTSNDDNLLSVAFLNPDDTTAVVVLNQTGQSRDFNVWMAGKAVHVGCPAHSIETVLLKP